VNDLFVAIRALNKSALMRDLQPNTRMAQRTLAAIAIDTELIDNLRLWSGGYHRGILSLAKHRDTKPAPRGGKPQIHFIVPK
jgi:hypothetical protein